MIPIRKENYSDFDISKLPSDENEKKRILLLRTQFRWLNKNKNFIYDKARCLYVSYKKERLPKRVVERCCNFPMLETKCQEYSYSKKTKESV